MYFAEIQVNTGGLGGKSNHIQIIAHGLVHCLWINNTFYSTSFYVFTYAWPNDVLLFNVHNATVINKLFTLVFFYETLFFILAHFEK